MSYLFVCCYGSGVCWCSRHVFDQALCHPMCFPNIQQKAMASKGLKQQAVLGEGMVQKRSYHERRVQTAAVKAAQMVNRLEQEIMQLQRVQSTAKTNYQAAQVAKRYPRCSVEIRRSSSR